MSISNIGNTCYLGSALHCIMNTRFLDQYIRTLHLNKSKTNPIVYTYSALHMRVMMGQTQVDPTPFYTLVRQSYPYFNNKEQHDAHEAIQVILDMLSTNMSALAKSTYTHPDNILGCLCWNKHSYNAIDEIFKVQYKTVIKCSHCTYELIKYQCEYGILTTTLHSLGYIIKLDDYKCDKCGTRDHCTQRTTIYHYPPNLVVYSDNFLELNDSGCLKPPGYSKWYKLYATCNHSTSKVLRTSGHYTAFVKNYRTNQWHYKNDDLSCLLVKGFSNNRARILDGAVIFMLERIDVG